MDHVLPTADFLYPTLPPKEDAIRILTIEPGDFDAPVTSTLTPVTFGARPKYAALSYTWDDPYPNSTALPAMPKQRNASCPRTKALPEPHSSGSQPIITNEPDSIIVNNHYFPVKHNLLLALRHLRSPTHRLSLWIDAICINQKDVGELNTQVAMMSFIYRRASLVVAWLGVGKHNDYADYGQYNTCTDVGQFDTFTGLEEYDTESNVEELDGSDVEQYVFNVNTDIEEPDAYTSVFQSMRLDWSSGQTQYLAEHMGGTGRMRSSQEPDLVVFKRIGASSYWTRVWIVQEACMPHRLAFALGANIWTHEDLCKWSALTLAKLSNQQPDRPVEMFRLLDTREFRHSEDMVLGNLLEVFSGAACSEIRDRIYGLLGLANDITTYSGGDKSVEGVEMLGRDFESLDLKANRIPEPPRGRGKFKVDYTQPLSEVWLEVLKHLYLQAKTVGGKKTRDVLRVTLAKAALGGLPVTDQERYLNIVKASGIIQKALGQKMSLTSLKASTPVVRALGYMSGEVLEVGPEYTALISSSRSEADWLSLFDRHYSDPEDLEVLRRTYEVYMAEIVRYGDEELSRIREIRSPKVRSWFFPGEMPRYRESAYAAEYEYIWDEGTKDSSTGHMICLCTGRQIGIVPSIVRPGDVLIRFFDCSAAVVMRPRAALTRDQPTSFMLVGRADAAEVAYKDAVDKFGDRYDLHAARGFAGLLSSRYTERSRAPGAVYVDFDLDTLQQISAFINIGE
ncbi:heterokaryon incompatibility protein-domain-containing protein [Hypoxylon sp. FL1284]|nr:heterokaryon incompatibility protein-domain-containing protein [Hypoxylon sp. FL1284]